MGCETNRWLSRFSSDSERIDGAESIYRPILQSLIADLMERIYGSEEPQEQQHERC